MPSPGERFEIEPSAVTQPRRSRGRSGCFWVLAGFGCLGIVLLTCSGLVLIPLIGLSSVFKNSEAYQHAIEVTQNDPRVQSAMGDNIQPSWPITGSINVNNDQGSADITIPITGSKGSGRIRVVAKKNNGEWSYSSVQFTDPDGQTTELAEPSLPAVDPEAGNATSPINLDAEAGADNNSAALQ